MKVCFLLRDPLGLLGNASTTRYSALAAPWFARKTPKLGRQNIFTRRECRGTVSEFVDAQGGSQVQALFSVEPHRWRRETKIRTKI